MQARLFKSRWPLVAVLGLSLGLAATTAARAAPTNDAEPLVQEGIALRTAFKDLEALDKFQRAYQISQTPRIQAQIGAAEQALGRWVDAEVHVKTALAAATDSWIAKNRATLETALAAIQAHLGSLDVIGGPAGATIRIDSREVARMPLTAALRLPVGSTTIEVRAIGYFPITRAVSIEAGKFTRETIVLPAISAGGNPTATAASPPMIGAAAASTEPASIDVPTQPSHHATSQPTTDAWRRPLAWTLAGGAVVGVGVGVAALVVRNDKATQYNRLADSSGCGGADLSTCESLHRSGDRASTAAILGFSAAGALAIASSVLFLTAGSQAPGPVAAAFRMCTVEGATAIACRLSF